MAFLWLLAPLLFAHASPAAGPRKLLLLVGGSGDPPGASTMFDENTATYGKFAREAGWESTVLYDGSHPASVQTAEKSFGTGTQSFTPDHFQAALTRYESMLASGQLKRGDEVMILIETHGGLPDQGEQTHRVSTEADPLSLDELRPLVAHLSEAGVRTAIVDTSCYGGASQSLANDHTCVVSTSAATRVSYKSSAMSAAFRSGQSLEDVFLAARRSDLSPDFPEISSQAGRTTAAFLKPLLMDSYTTKGEADYEPAKSCSEQARDEDQLSKLLQNMHEIFAATPVDQGDLINSPLNFLLPSLKDQLRAYEEARGRYEQHQLELSALTDRPGPIPEITNQAGKPLTYGEIENLLAHPENETELRKLLSEDTQDRVADEAGLKALDALDRLAAGPEIKAIREKRLQLWTNEGTALDLYGSAFQIGVFERPIYDKIYASHRSEKKTEEPCASFSL